MPTLKEFETWLSAGQVMEITGYSKQGVINLAEARKIRAVKTTIGWLFDPQSVQMFAKQAKLGQCRASGNEQTPGRGTFSSLSRAPLFSPVLVPFASTLLRRGIHP